MATVGLVEAAEPPITAVAFSPQGEVITASQAGAFVLKATDFSLQKKLATRLENIHDIAFAADGRSLILVGGSPGEAGEFEVFRWPAGERMASGQLENDVLRAVATEGDGRWVAAAASGAVVRFDGAAEKPIRLIKHTGPVNDVVVLNGGDEKEGDRMIVSAGADHTIRVWNAADGELVRTFDNHTGAVQSLAVRPQAEGLPMIASASADRTIRFWQPTIGRMVRFLRLDDAPLAIAFTPGGDKLLAATVAGELIVIDPDAAEITATLPGIEGWAYSLAVTPDGKHALIAGAGGEKKLLPLK